MPQPRPYVPFEFEDVFTPAETDIGPLIYSAPERRTWLIRAAVSDAGLTECLLDQCKVWTAGADPSMGVVAVFVAEQLGLKSLSVAMGNRLLEADDEWLAYTVPAQWDDRGSAQLRFDRVEDARRAGSLVGYDLGWLMTDFVLRSCTPADPASKMVKRFAARTPALQALAWGVLEPEDFETALGWVPGFLERSPQYANEVATRYALLAKEQCPRLASLCAQLPKAARTDLGHALEKNLRRIGRIKLWVACREALREGVRPH
jgi:hypothetical protein